MHNVLYVLLNPTNICVTPAYEYHSQDLREMDETWRSFSSIPQRDFEVHSTRPNTFVFLNFIRNFTYVIVSKPQIFQSRYILYVSF